METKCYELLSILNYPISENLFKEKIGTGETLKELVESEILTENFGYYLVNLNSDVIKNVDNSNNTSDLHENIIKTYYLKMIDEKVNSDYERFSKGYKDYINLSYHYKKLSKFNEAIENLFRIAKKLTFWGLGKELIKELDDYKAEQLSTINYLWKEYYIFFFELIHPAGEIDEGQFFNFIENLEGQGIAESHTLYLETKNLEGIYYKKIKKDNKKALTIFKTAIIENKKLEGHLDKELSVSYARILENLAISINGFNLDEANNLFDKAENIFLEYDDHYELAKLYFLKLVLLSNTKEASNLLIIKEYQELSEILKKYTFPDIERNLFNLLSDKVYVKNNDFDQYIEFKIHALTRDLVLYYENFEMDFFDILHKIEKVINTKGIKIEESIDLLLEFFTEIKLKDEVYFMEGIKAYLLGEDLSKKLSEIENEDFQSFAHQYIKRFSLISKTRS